MAIDITEKESLTATQAIALFREALGDPDLKEGVFYNAVGRGYITPLEEQDGKRGRLYSRADVIGLAAERKFLESLLSVNQVIEAAASRSIALKHKDVMRLIESGQLQPEKRFGRQYFFRPEDVDATIVSLIDIRVLHEKTKGLMETVPAVAWINARLEAMGRSDRIELATLYKQVDREIVKPDVRIPAGSKNAAWRFFWSEETLKKHPIFDLPPEMPEGVEAIPISYQEKLVATPKGVHIEYIPEPEVLQSLQLEWGNILTRKEVREQGLSAYATTAKKKEPHRVTPVGYVIHGGQRRMYFPAKYIPKRNIHKNKDLKEIRDMLNEES